MAKQRRAKQRTDGAHAPTPTATRPDTTDPGHYRHALTYPRYVTDQDRWTRNRISTVIIAVDDGRVSITRPQHKSERSTSSGPQATGDMAIPSVMRAEGGGARMFIDTPGDSPQCAAMLIAVLGAVGYDAVDPDTLASRAARKSAKSKGAIRKATEPVILDFLASLSDPNRAALVTLNCEPNAATAGLAPIVHAASLAAEQGLDASPKLRSAYVLATGLNLGDVIESALDGVGEVLKLGEHTPVSEPPKTEATEPANATAPKGLALAGTED